MNDNRTDTNQRAAYTAGLRALADILDNHPEVPLPYEGSGCDIGISFLSGDDPRGDMAAAARAFPITFAKTPWSGGGTDYFALKGRLAGLKISLTAYRDAVCERVVTGTREVEVEEHDPEALAALPKVKRTVKIEDVEWHCAPLLDGAR